MPINFNKQAVKLKLLYLYDTIDDLILVFKINPSLA